jgi:hypothetical protein
METGFRPEDMKNTASRGKPQAASEYSYTRLISPLSQKNNASPGQGRDWRL